MKHKIAGIFFTVLFAFALTANGAPVTAEEAKLATRGWDLCNRDAFGRFGEVKKVSAEQDADGNILWYVVVTDNGAVVVAPDDEIEPIIAVIPGCDGTIPEASPLRAMLLRDMRQRCAGAAAVNKMKLAAGAAAQPSATAVKWKKLKTTATMKLLSPTGNPATIVRWLDGWNSPDTKVVEGRTVQTLRFWNQVDSEDYFTNSQIFNKDTPFNATCGCVATAGSAVMHYFRMGYGAEGLERQCTYGMGQTPWPLRTAGGVYDWSLIDNLQLKRGTPIELTEEQVNLLARVASDCGIGCGMSYNADGQGSSGSNTYNLGQSFRDVFNMENVQLVTTEGWPFGQGNDIGRANYADIIYNQLRGGAPVVLGIDRHEVVATGYGIDADQANYTYIFLGWGGMNDAWYQLPSIDTQATLDGGWYLSTFIDELLTCISPDDHFIPIVGRVLNYDGSVVTDATVELSDGQVLKVDNNGYWGTRIAPPAGGTGTVTVESPGHPVAVRTFEVGEEAMMTQSFGARTPDRLSAALPDAMEIVLENPCVRVAGQEFSSLNEALNYAGEELSHEEPVLVEVFKDALLLPTDYTIAFDCIIRSVAGTTNEIRRLSDSRLIVDAGQTVVLENLRFNEVGRPALEVLDDAKAELVGDVALDGIILAERGALALSGRLNPANAYAITAPSRSERGDVFATYNGALAEITKFAGQFSNTADDELRGKAVQTAQGVVLKWEVLPLPDKLAVATLTQNGETVSFDNLNTLFRMLKLDADAEVRILKNQALGQPLSMTNWVTVAEHTLTIRAPKDPVTVKGVRNSNLGECLGGFAVADGGTLILSKVTFSGYTKVNEPFIAVTGGEVVFKGYAGLDQITVIKQDNSTAGDKYKNLNPVYVESGRVTLQHGSLISNCTARAGNGGAVYLHGAGAVLDLAGKITGCTAGTAKKTTNSYGGGVYADAQSTVLLSGWATVSGNMEIGTRTVASDILIQTNNLIAVTAPLKGEVIGVRSYVTGEAATGKQFALMDSAAEMTPDELARSMQVFYNDRTPTLGASVQEDGTIIWQGAYLAPEPIVAPEPEPDVDPEPDPGPEPEPTPVVCQPFAFTAIVEQEDGSWKLTLAPATTYCTYTLKTSDDLQTWTPVGEAKTLQPGDDFEFIVDGGEAKRFWFVTGEDGVEP